MNLTKEKIAEYYLLGNTINQTAKNFNTQANKISIILNKIGIVRPKRKHTFDEKFFSMNTACSFYWAGFIAADGSLSNRINGKILTIELSSKDHDHLEKFKKAICFSGPIYKINRNKGSSKISISSNRIFFDLGKFNIVPRKTYTYTFPRWLVAHPLVNHFMRGYNDGDGSFFTRKGINVPQLKISICGTKKFLTTYSKILYENCNVSYRTPHLAVSTTTTCVIAYSGSRISVRVRDFLYKNSSMDNRMNRKYNIAFGKWFTNMPKNYSHKPVVGANIKTGVEIKFESVSSTAQSGFDPSSVVKCCKDKLKKHKGYTWEYA